MSSEVTWRRTTLQQAGISLIDCDHRTPTAATDGFPYIAIPQLKNGHVDLTGARRISSVDYAEWTRKLKPQTHDVIVVRRCNSGDSALVPSGLDCAIGQNLVVLRSNGSAVTPRFLRWLIRGPDWWDQVAKFINVGAVFDSLRCRDIPHFDLMIPPIDDQREIAALLDALDDRILLLRETNATLEAIAQALFKSWFVDFDPVHAKQQGIAPAGMDEATAALFPESFEGSVLGFLPKGWRVESIYVAAKVIYGAPFSSGIFNTDQVGKPLIRIRDLRDESPGIFTSQVHPNGYLVKPGDIIVGMDGEFRAYLWGGDEAWLNQRVCVFAPMKGFPAAFVHRSINPILAAVEASETATTIIHLGKNDIERFKIVVSDESVLAAFGLLSDDLYRRIVANKQCARTLTTLRDTLLPRLISGQLRLPQAEIQLREALA